MKTLKLTSFTTRFKDGERVQIPNGMIIETQEEVAKELIEKGLAEEFDGETSSIASDEQLKKYLPLTGGTMSGDIEFSNETNWIKHDSNVTRVKISDHDFMAIVKQGDDKSQIDMEEDYFKTRVESNSSVTKVDMRPDRIELLSTDNTDDSTMELQLRSDRFKVSPYADSTKEIYIDKDGVSINGLINPTNDGDAVPLGYLNERLEGISGSGSNEYLSLSGGTVNGELNITHVNNHEYLATNFTDKEITMISQSRDPFQPIVKSTLINCAPYYNIASFNHMEETLEQGFVSKRISSSLNLGLVNGISLRSEYSNFKSNNNSSVELFIQDEEDGEFVEKFYFAVHPYGIDKEIRPVEFNDKKLYIRELAEPTNNTDAVNKKYVDEKTAPLIATYTKDGYNASCDKTFAELLSALKTGQTVYGKYGMRYLLVHSFSDNDIMFYLRREGTDQRYYINHLRDDEIEFQREDFSLF